LVIIDTSAWIEFFHDGELSVVERVDSCLEQELVGMGDLVYCEVMQGIRSARERREIDTLFLSLPRYEMVGFEMAERAAKNYRTLRARGVTVRKTIDVLIGTFCAEHDFALINHDRDFDLMAKHIGLTIWQP